MKKMIDKEQNERREMFLLFKDEFFAESFYYVYNNYSDRIREEETYTIKENKKEYNILCKNPTRSRGFDYRMNEKDIVTIKVYTYYEKYIISPTPTLKEISIIEEKHDLHEYKEDINILIKPVLRLEDIDIIPTLKKKEVYCIFYKRVDLSNEHSVEEIQQFFRNENITLLTEDEVSKAFKDNIIFGQDT